MKSTSFVSNLWSVAALAALIALTFAVYSPGLHGGFIFDDYPNLEELANYGGVVDFSTFKAFVFHGISSPLGRPLALATFLLDSNTWPAEPYSFKATNLKIHVLAGLFVCWASLNLMRLGGVSDQRATWIALLSASMWLLHPYMVSTTLYVVQRMAQLSALFVLVGITFYLHGRIVQVKGRVLAGYIWMSASLALATPLAVLSKENGILLPVLILVIEFCFSKRLPPLLVWWKCIFLMVPALVVLWLLLREINFAKGAWPDRPFTQPERLLTEPRIIWEYLYYLWVPHIEGRGLYQDGYNFSKSILNPISTLTSLIGLLLVTAAAIFYRKKYTIICLSVLFFFAGHLLESSTIALELYFEHRNYLPSVFLFLPLAIVIVDASEKLSITLLIVVASLILLLLSFFTWQRANLWANTESLQNYWAASTPESPRARAKIVMGLMSLGRTNEGIRYIEESVEALPQSSLLAISLLLVKVHTETASEADFNRIQNLMKAQRFDAQSVAGLRNLAEDVVTPGKLQKYGRDFLILLSALEDSSNFNKVSAFRRLAPYLKARVYIAFNEPNEAFLEYKKAIPLHHDADASLAMVAEMARAGRPREAMELLEVAKAEFKKQSDKSLLRSRESYDIDIQHLQHLLEVDLHALKAKTEDTLNERGR